MPDDGHKTDFPSKADIADFLDRFGTHDQIASRSGVARSTLQKWHLAAGKDIGAVKLLRVILSHDNGISELAAWLRLYRPSVESPPAPAGEPLPARAQEGRTPTYRELQEAKERATRKRRSG